MCDYARSASPWPDPLVEPNSAISAEPIQERGSHSSGHFHMELSVNSTHSFEATRAPAGLQSGKDFTDHSNRLLHIAVSKSLGEIRDINSAQRGTPSLQNHSIWHAKHSSLISLMFQTIHYRDWWLLQDHCRLWAQDQGALQRGRVPVGWMLGCFNCDRGAFWRELTDNPNTPATSKGRKHHPRFLSKVRREVSVISIYAGLQAKMYKSL